MDRKPTYEELEQQAKSLEEYAVERSQAEKNHSAYLSFLENTDRFDRAIRQSTDLEQVI